MDCFTDVRMRCQKKNQLLFTRQSPCLQPLRQSLCAQNHRTIVAWVFVCIDDIAARLHGRVPGEQRIDRALSLCKAWARGEVKMPVAKRALLDVHAMAREVDSPCEIALLHAIGQGCAAVHVETHAIGVALYELTAIVRQQGIDNFAPAVERRIARYIACMEQCRQAEDDAQPWASFLRDDTRPNKERLLWEKQQADIPRA